MISSGNRHNNYLYTIFSICFISGLFGAVVSVLMSSYLPVVMREFIGAVNGQDAERASAVINSMFLFGWMFGGIAFGMVSDHAGRKAAVVLSTAFYAVFTILTAIAGGWWWIVLFRFLSGFGVGGVIVSTTILVSEVWPAGKRAIAIGILTICFPAGVFLAGAITYLLPGWRTAFFTGFVPLALSIISYFIIKEPLKEKMDHLHSSKMERIRQLFYVENRKNILTGTIIFGAMLIGLWAIFTWLPTWIDGIAPAGDEQKARGMAMMSLAGAALAGGSLSGWFTKIAGWKKTMFACFAVCFLMSFLLFKQSNLHLPAVYLKIGILGFFFGVSQGVLSDYLSTIFPVAIRATATGFCFNAGRSVTATVVFFVGWLVSFFGSYGNSIFVFSWVFVLGMMATLFVKENASDGS